MKATQTFVFALLQQGVMAARSTIAIAPLEIQGKTPCCVDRLTTLACSRLASTRKRYFEQQCTNNADFALIQCCASCFNKKKRDSRKMYEQTVKKLLLDPYSTNCVDRRGPIWCHKILSRENTYGTGTETVHSCKSFPFAFRECRQSCGFCAVGQNSSRLRYNYTLATDGRRCTSKIYYALEIDSIPPSTIKMPLVNRMTTKIIQEIPIPTASPIDEDLDHRERIIFGVLANFTMRPSIVDEEIASDLGSIEERSLQSFTHQSTTSLPLNGSFLELNQLNETTESVQTTTEFDPLSHLDLERRRSKHKGYFIAEITENDLAYEGPPREQGPDF